MKINISKTVKEQFPELKLGIIVAKNILNSSNISSTNELEKKVLNQVHDTFKSNEDLSENVYISQWRKIYRELGSKPSKYRPTVEALLRRIIKGGELPRINLAVNSYLLAEIQTLLPVGGYDLDKIDGAIHLRHSMGDEEFTDFTGKKELTFDGEIIYCDDNDILTKRWNYRDCNKAQITENSKNIILCIEAPSSIFSLKDLEKTLKLIEKYIRQYCDDPEIEMQIIH